MDFKTFVKQFQQTIAHPIIRLIFVPMVYLLYGITFGQRFGRVNFLGTFFLMVFVIVCQLLEQYFFINQMKKGYIKWENAYVILGVLATLIVIMWPLTNTIYFILASAYLASIVAIYGFFRLKGSLYYLTLQVFLKAFVLSVLSAFMQVNFVSLRLLIEILPLMFITLFYFSELEALDNVKYGTFTHHKLLQTLSLTGLVGMFVTQFFIGKLAFTSIFQLVVWCIVLGYIGLRLITHKRLATVEKSKNFTATLFAIVVLLYSIM